MLKLKKVQSHSEFMQPHILQKLKGKIEKITKERNEAGAVKKYLKLSRAKNDVSRKTLHAYFTAVGKPSRESIDAVDFKMLEDNPTVTGYDRDRTLRNHVRQILDKIESLTKEDGLKQIELVTALFKRVKSFKETAKHSDEAWNSIQASLQNFFMTLYDRYKGRYPNKIRAADQIVCAAICNDSSERKLSVIAHRCLFESIGSCQKHMFELYLEGDCKTFFEPRGKLRDDSHRGMSAK